MHKLGNSSALPGVVTWVRHETVCPPRQPEALQSQKTIFFQQLTPSFATRFCSPRRGHCS
jgi:hypothetical protein